jgi:aminoglycoside phosphotransferase (APT) family kinase protein
LEVFLIPDAKKAAVARALQETFGTSEFEDIALLAAGVTSALVLRIVVKGRPYILRVCTRTDGANEPTRQFACMKIAAEAGIAPRVLYTNIEERVSIIDLVQARPLPAREALVPLALRLRTLHALTPFAKLVNDFDTAPTFLLRSSAMRDGFIQRVQAAKILPEGEEQELLQLCARMRSIYPWHDSDLVSSHNDLKPANIVFDGARLWLIDWEAAFLNDRYNDLAVMANFVVTNDEDEESYLQTYFGEAAGEYRRARFYLMRQVVHMFYGMVYTLLGSAGKPIDPNEPAPDFRDFHNRVWTGEVCLETGEMKIQFGRIHMNQLLQNMRTREFEGALRVISDQHANK